MDWERLKRLAGLPRLDHGQDQRRTCKICGADALPFGVEDFQKVCAHDPYMFGMSGIPVYYHRCTSCEFLFTDFVDNWTTEDFSRFIYNEDYIKVDADYAEKRPKNDAGFFADLLRFQPDLTVLDFGGGAGVLAATLREAGFDAECYDPFSSPARPQRRFDVITCMEVLEHSADPVSTLRDMASLLNNGGCILVGTGVQPSDIETIRTGWWYVAPRNGHISLQSESSLAPLGEAAGLIAYPSASLHGFAKEPSAVSAAILAQIGRPTVTLLLSAPDTAQPASWMPTCDPADWHDVEDASFRWSARDELVWRWTPPIADCSVQLRLQFKLEIEPDFLARSQLFVGDLPVASRIANYTLKAIAPINGAAPITIRLKTPPPRTPFEVNGVNDLRPLGVAIHVRGMVPAG